MGIPALYAQPIHVTVTGKVTDTNGKALPDVAVTDGNNIVNTDRNGTFRLLTVAQAKFVYITVPSGYDIPNEHGIAAFYRKIVPNEKGYFKANFRLRKMQRSDSLHYTIVWADPQVNTPEQAKQLLSGPVPDTKAEAARLLLKGPVHGIAVGDIAWDAPAIIPAYKEAVHQTGIPFFQVLGNHDMDIHVRSDEMSDRTHTEAFGPAWYSFDRGSAHYVVLDNVFYYADGYNYLGYITEQQFRWLEQDLARVKKGSPVFVSMHISAYTGEKKRYNRTKDEPGNITFNRKFLFEMLKPFKAHLLTGHTHYNENREEEGVFEHIHGALCGAWWTANVCSDGTPMGYGVYEVNGDSVSWYYKAVGYAPDHQLKLYPPGTDETHPRRMIANVWNWDAAWKVEWYENNVRKGEMVRYTGKDPEAKSLFEGADKPGTYKWIEPGLTDHLFYAEPVNADAIIEVRVTDRFGRIYKANLSTKQRL